MSNDTKDQPIPHLSASARSFISVLGTVVVCAAVALFYLGYQLSTDTLLVVGLALIWVRPLDNIGVGRFIQHFRR